MVVCSLGLTVSLRVQMLHSSLRHKVVVSSWRPPVVPTIGHLMMKRLFVHMRENLMTILDVHINELLRIKDGYTG